MTRTTSHTLLVLGTLLGVLAIGPAQADPVNYSSLQELFGEPITTSVTGSPQRVSEAPAAMDIITQDDIRRSGADNMPDVLQFVTGLDFRRYSFSQADVAIRGYDRALSPRMLVLVNGRQAYLDDFGYVDWNAIPVVLSEIRQIEVVKGPQSALFGFNAAAGVINIITFDPVLDSTNSATVRTGTQNLGEGEAVGTGHIGKTFGVRVSIAGYTAQEFQNIPTEDYPAPRNHRLNFDSDWQIMQKLRLHAEVGFSEDRYAEYLTFFQPANTRTNDERLGFDAETPIGLISLDNYRNESKEIFAGVFNAENVVRVVKLNDLVKIGSSNTIRAGLEYRNNRDSSEFLFHGTVSYDDYAATLMWNTVLSPSLTLVNAVRIDHVVLHDNAWLLSVSPNTISDYNNTTITTPSFNSGLVYAVSQADTVRLTLARGLQMPSLINFGLQIGGPSSGVVGSPYLRPAATWNIDLGDDHTLRGINSVVAADVFVQRNTNLIGSLGTGPVIFSRFGAALTDINVGSSNEVGLEVGIKGQSPHGLRWNASYRLVSIRDDITSDASSDGSTRYAHGTPTSMIIAGAGYTTGRWEFDLKARWQSDYHDYSVTDRQPVLIGDYVTIAGRIGYDVTRHITLAGSGEQVNLSRLRETAGLLVDRRFIASATAHF